MNTLLLALILLAIAACACAMIDVSRTLRRLRCAVDRIADKEPAGSFSSPMFYSIVAGGRPGGGGYAVWVNRGGNWQLEEDRCEAGYEPGPQPTIGGDYEGQRIRREAVSCVPEFSIPS